ncbi:NYN domain-containing protein [Stakelama tenebrarum]|uniref:NYN domain-containing protein n=1 Tax=Stakelama tenebrarum TaxID=2711215 RepID=A0A6G6YAN4_9SPHN|nr:NYN domain-containing protein [Sphingosinithalassobacter tenebrarum]QIG81877.1 NYN domain-containing protein [Sphingosinithalassobacter tenebrarum]
MQTNPNGPPEGNVALLIDADNASPASIDPVLTVLAELGTVNIRRVYGNWRKQSLKGWADMTLKHGIEPYQQFDITKGKNATDMRMTIDAMDLLFRGRVTGFGILSSDSDFMPLAMRIRQEGLPVYGFGTPRTPDGFRQACTRFIDVDALIKSGQPPQPDAAASEPAPLDKDLLKLLVDAYNSAKRDERGFAELSDVGQRAGNRSSFDTRNYGYSRLSDLIETIPNFQTERREGGRVYVKRVR